MPMTAEELHNHKTMLARMGMRYTEVYGPTDMSEPKVQTRMREVAAKAVEVPSIFNDLNDFDLGNQVRMLMREDSGHEGVVCAARDRIFQLSLRVAELQGALAIAAGELEEAADKFWVFHCNAAVSVADSFTRRRQLQDKEFLAAMSSRMGTAAKTARGVVVQNRGPEPDGAPLGSTVDLGPATAMLDGAEQEDKA